MIKWLRTFKDSDRQTKVFALNWLLHGVVIIGTAIYCYARLDFVRSGISTKKTHEDTRK